MATKSRTSIDMAALTNHGRWTPTEPYANAAPTEIRRLERFVHRRHIELHIQWFKGRIDQITAVYYPNLTYNDIQLLHETPLPDSLSSLPLTNVSIPLFRTRSAAMADTILDMIFDPAHTPVHSTPGANIPDPSNLTAGTIIPIPNYPKKSAIYYQMLAAPTWVSPKSYLYDLTVERPSSRYPQEFTPLYMIPSDTHGYLTPIDEGYGAEYVTDLMHTLSVHEDNARLCEILRLCLIPGLSYNQLMELPTTLTPMVIDALEHRA